ncbi:MAG: YggT family protein [Pyrinomonadaceae bacterium MAG19_C2-C3]|nr:YggT family protein [Pyrinomonadaceae bacterium MAG19_C2-C3]
MQDDKLAADEARRATQHNSVKEQIESDVNSEIAARADHTTPGEAARMNNLAGDFRHKAINEVAQSEREVGRSRGIARVSQVVDYIFFLIYTLLAIRLVLALLAARSEAGFVQLIRNITDPLYAPFRGIVGSPSIEGGYTLALPIVIAIVVYALVHAGINGLLRLFAHRKTEI